MLPVPCPVEQEARDDILGGIPMAAIAGLFPTFAFHEEIIAPNQVPSVQNWTCFKPEARKQGDLGRGAERSNREVQRIIAKRKSVRRLSHSKGREGIRRRRRGSGAPTRPDWVGADAPAHGAPGSEAQ